MAEPTKQTTPPKEESWFDKAKQSFQQGLQQGGKALAAISGAGAGALAEIGDFASGLTETTDKRFYPFTPFDPKTEGSFPEFARHLKDYAEGKVPLPKPPLTETDEGKPLPPTGKVMVKDPKTGKYREETAAEREAGAGFKRVLQGTIGATAPRSGTEQKYEATPFYQATKRDLLNIGEGLGGILQLASGFDTQRQAEFREENRKAGRPGGYAGELAAAGQAGAEVGRDIAGGLIGIPAILLGGLRQGRGSSMIEEQPITYALNALPVLGRLAGAARTGLLSRVQVAELNSRVAKLGIQGVSTIDDLNKHIKGLTDPVVRAAEEAKVPPLLGEAAAAAAKTFGKAAPVERAVLAAGEVAGQALKKGPLVAAGYSLGGPVGAVVGGAVQAAPMLLNFMRGTQAGEKVAKAVRKKVAPAKRQFVEPRAYETPEAAEIGEALLQTEGETAVVSQKLQPAAEAAKKGFTESFVEKTPQSLVEAYNNVEKSKATLQGWEETIKTLEEIRRKQGTPFTPEDLQKITEQRLEYQRAITEAERLKETLKTQVENDPNVVISPELTEPFDLNEPPKVRQLKVDFTEPQNERVLLQTQEAIRGTELQNVFDTPEKVKQFASNLIISQNTPLIWLADSSLRERVIRKFNEVLLPTKRGRASAFTEGFGATTEVLTPDQKAVINNALLDISNRAYNNGNPTTLRASIYSVLQPLIEQRLISGEDVAAIEKAFREKPLETLVREAGGVDYNPTNPVLTRTLQTLQNKFRQDVVAPSILRMNELPVGFQFQRVVDAFKAGEPFAPEAIDFDPQPLIDTLRREATETTDPVFRGNKAYKDFLRETADTLEKLKAPQLDLGARRVAPSVAGLPLQNQYDFTLNIPEMDTASKYLQGLKRLSTIYNPMTGLGNYLGNSFVRMIDTGSPLPLELVRQQAGRLWSFVRTKAAEKGIGTFTPPKGLTLQDELVLRAVPARDILSAAETGTEQALFAPEKTTIGKAFRAAYDYGDAVFKLDKATTLSRNVIADLPKIPEGKAAYLPVAPEMTLSVMRNGDKYTFINPETGKILTSGTIESPAVKRILGSSIKFVVDGLYPDVSQLPEFFTKFVQGRGGIGSKVASAMVFTPFMSYVIKASDNPFRKGILGNLVEGNVSSPLQLPYSTTAPIPRTAAAKELFSFGLGQGLRYASSRAAINSMAARFETLSADEKEQLRLMYAFTPAKQKPIMFAGLVNLDNGQQVPRFIQPSFTNFWSYTDDLIRGFGWGAKSMGRAFDKAMGDPELKSDEQLDYFAKQILTGKDPTAADAFRAAGMSGGLLYPLIVKAIESEQLGKPDLSVRDFLKPLGILGRIIQFAGEEAAPQFFNDKVNTTRAVAGTTYGKLMDVIIGSQLSKEQTPQKAANFLNKFYDDQYLQMIQPLLNKGATDPENQMLYQAMAEEINTNLQQVILMRKESFNNTMAKLGIEQYIKNEDLRFKKPKIKEQMVEEKETTGETQPTGAEQEPPKFEGMEPNEPPKFEGMETP